MPSGWAGVVQVSWVELTTAMLVAISVPNQTVGAP